MLPGWKGNRKGLGGAEPVAAVKESSPSSCLRFTINGDGGIALWQRTVNRFGQPTDVTARLNLSLEKNGVVKLEQTNDYERVVQRTMERITRLFMPK